MLFSLRFGHDIATQSELSDDTFPAVSLPHILGMKSPSSFQREQTTKDFIDYFRINKVRCFLKKNLSNQEASIPIKLEELQKIPYANISALGDRQFLLMPYWNGQRWFMWVNTAENTLLEMKPIDVAQSYYVAKNAASEDDIWIPFIDLVWQRACWPETYNLLRAIGDDFHNLATSVAKLKHLHNTHHLNDPRAINSFVETELEYLTITARTIFDLLQETIAVLWNERIKLLDEEAEKLRKRHKLPPTFSKMVMREKQEILNVQDLVEKYSLPSQLAETYIKYADFFVWLRKSRDKIVHRGKALPSVFVTEKGFCIDPKTQPYSGFNGWKEEHKFNENISSLLPWITYVIFQTIEACSEIMLAFAQNIRFPDEIAPDHRVFIRDHVNNTFLDLLKVSGGKLIWWEAPAEQPISSTPSNMEGVI